MPSVFIPIQPVPKPRMTRADKWKVREVVARYRGFCDELRLRANVAGMELTGQVGLRFYMPIPKRLAHEMKMGRARLPLVHREKPDVDNLIKAVFDAMLDEDKTVYEVHAQKFYGETPGILIVTDEPLTDYPP